MKNETKLLRKAAKGDIEAFGELIQSYERLVFSIAYRMFANVEDAKDLSQEILIKVYKNIQYCGDMQHFKSWLCTIARNTCLDEIRKRKVRITADSLTAEPDGEAVPIRDTSATPEESMIQSEDRAEIEDILQALSDEHKEILILRDIEGFSYQEISEITNTPIGTIKSKLSRARMNFRKKYSERAEQNKDVSV